MFINKFMKMFKAQSLWKLFLVPIMVLAGVGIFSTASLATPSLPKLPKPPVVQKVSCTSMNVYMIQNGMRVDLTNGSTIFAEDSFPIYAHVVGSTAASSTGVQAIATNGGSGQPFFDKTLAGANNNIPFYATNILAPSPRTAPNYQVVSGYAVGSDGTHFYSAGCQVTLNVRASRSSL
jgi:hypothetical protein